MSAQSQAPRAVYTPLQSCSEIDCFSKATHNRRCLVASWPRIRVIKALWQLRGGGLPLPRQIPKIRHKRVRGRIYICACLYSSQDNVSFVLLGTLICDWLTHPVVKILCFRPSRFVISCAAIGRMLASSGERSVLSLRIWTDFVSSG